MSDTTPVEFLDDLPDAVKEKFCKSLQKDNEWERLVGRFIDVRLTCFSITRDLQQEKHHSSESQKLLQLMILHKFKTVQLYKVLATLQSMEVMACLEDYVPADMRKKIQEAMLRISTLNEKPTEGYIKQLPEDVRRELCDVLNADDISWKRLVAQFEDAGFNFYTISLFKNECPSSPSSELLKQLGDRNFSTNLLYTALASLGLLKAMSLLEDYVSETLISTLNIQGDYQEDDNRKESNITHHDDEILDSSPLITASNNYLSDLSEKKNYFSSDSFRDLNKNDVTKCPVLLSYNPRGEGLPGVSYAELEDATERWNEKYLIGSIRKKHFYRCCLNGHDVTIKQYHEWPEILKELRVLYSAKNKYIFKMLMIVEGEKEKSHPCIIYSFMSNGSLYDYLQNMESKTSCLNWQQRQKIAIGIAEGLSYLYQSFKQAVIVKSTDVMLNDKMEPLLADVLLPCQQGEFPESFHPYVPPFEKNVDLKRIRLDTFCLGTILTELVLGKSPYCFDVHPKKRFSFSKGSTRRNVFDCRGGDLSPELKASWIALIIECYNGGDISILKDQLGVDKLYAPK